MRILVETSYKNVYFNDIGKKVIRTWIPSIYPNFATLFHSIYFSIQMCMARHTTHVCILYLLFCRPPLFWIYKSYRWRTHMNQVHQFVQICASILETFDIRFSLHMLTKVEIEPSTLTDRNNVKFLFELSLFGIIIIFVEKLFWLKSRYLHLIT